MIGFDIKGSRGMGVGKNRSRDSIAQEFGDNLFHWPCSESSMKAILGFTLTEVNQLLALRLSPDMTCTDVRKRAQAKVADIEQKIQSLQAMKQALQDLVSACAADGPARKCSFLANLDQRKLP